MDPQDGGSSSKEAPLIDFDAFKDVRSLYKDELLQSVTLGLQFPAPFSPALRMNGLDVLVVLIRHLYRHTIIKDRKEIATDEKQNPLLRFAWCMFGDDHDSITLQSNTRIALEEWLVKQQGLHPRLTFLDLVDSNLMVETMFTKTPFLLFRSIVPSKARDEEGGEWKPTRFDPKQNAASSLVRWNGAGDLGEYISNKIFGVQNPDQNSYLYTFAQPVFIRVRYDNFNITRTFKELAEIWVQDNWVLTDGTVLPYALKPDSEPTDKLIRRKYRLIAAVRARTKAEDENQDAIRRWHLAGPQLADPKGSSFANDQWTLEQLAVPESWTYMLYYCITPEGHRPVLAAGLPEQRRHQPDFARNLERMQNAVKNASRRSKDSANEGA
ncbi:hypothetical protein G7054_g1414 [Neopestalotiopsis clavispora]|nr:hypothetical protein G7054_g1414 [Neopestalotiopsis clavispora]